MTLTETGANLTRPIIYGDVVYRNKYTCVVYAFNSDWFVCLYDNGFVYPIKAYKYLKRAITYADKMNFQVASFLALV